MNSIHRYISHVFTDESEEQRMEVDNDYTDRYLSQFSSVDRQTIDVMVDNGYQDRDSLLAFDLKEDLPLLPDLNMAQKSLLRKALKHLHDSQEFEARVVDVKGDDQMTASPVVSPSMTAAANSQSKRKRESIVNRSSPPKRSRVSADTSPPFGYEVDDGLGTRMRQMITGRKSIRSANASDSDSYGGRVGGPPKRTNNGPPRRQCNRPVPPPVVTASNATRETDSSDDDFGDEDVKPVIEIINSNTSGRKTRNSIATPISTPISVDNNSGNNRRASHTPTARPKGSYPPRRMVPPMVIPMVSPPARAVATPPAQSATRSDAYVPTPTEIEVRERLAAKKASATKTKSGRKRR